MRVCDGQLPHAGTYLTKQTLESPCSQAAQKLASLQERVASLAVRDRGSGLERAVNLATTPCLCAHKGQEPYLIYSCIEGKSYLSGRETTTPSGGVYFTMAGEHR